MTCAIIPARGGSQRIPRKNIRPFCGKPMIGWVIETLRSAGCFERIIVSTDDTEIADVARDFGADVPFVRPADLADAFTGTTDVITHALSWLEGQGERVDALACVYATAAFLRPEDLQNGRARFEEGEWDFTFAATPFAAPIERALRRSETGAMEMDNPAMFPVRSQDLAPAFHDAGQFYLGKAEAWREKRPIFGAASTAVEIPPWRVQDIDTPEDWTRAELLFKLLGYA